VAGETSDEEPDALPPKPTKTPVYAAFNADRYHRQSLIREYEASTGNYLLTYTAGRSALISREDPVYLVDLLHNLVRGKPIDLILHTPGGDVDAAEKFLSLLQAYAEPKRLRIIVPDFAKSAGTLIALGADGIVMSDASELGPIDPQIVRYDRDGNESWHSVLNYLDAFAQHAADLRADPNDIVASIMIDKLDPTQIKRHEMMRDRARNFAERELRKKGLNYTAIASDLIDTKRWLSHGQMINWEAARLMDLPVDYVPLGDPRWLPIWTIYCHQRLAVQPSQKLFESAAASLVVAD
jgi:hypothetical protein